jgi:hypothetical protein
LVGYAALGEMIPIFPVYALLFTEHGLSGADVSALFVVWSLTTFGLEVPSGVLADLVSRRALLVTSALVNGLGYALWVGRPSYASFLVGFVLWGASSALASGTYQAFLYDELDASGQAHRYAQVAGWATSARLVSTVLAMLVAAPLVDLGGIELTGWVSAGVCGLQALVGRSLPRTGRHISSADAPDDPHLAATLPAGGWAHRYLSTLRSGLVATTGRSQVRRAVLLTASLYGFSAVDEYFGLAWADLGASTPVVATLFALSVAGEAVGALAAGRAGRLPNRALGGVTAVAAALIGVGAASGSLALAATGIAVGYGALQMVLVVSEARLQRVVPSATRATVLSVAGLGSEVFATSLFVGVGLGSVWLDFPTLVALCAAGPFLLAWLLPAWLPGRPVLPQTDVSTEAAT